jgi:hypothetical protein
MTKKRQEEAGKGRVPSPGPLLMHMHMHNKRLVNCRGREMQRGEGASQWASGPMTVQSQHETR